MQNVLQHALTISPENMNNGKFGLDVSQLQNSWDSINMHSDIDVYKDVNVEFSVEGWTPLNFL